MEKKQVKKETKEKAWIYYCSLSGYERTILATELRQDTVDWRDWSKTPLDHEFWTAVDELRDRWENGESLHRHEVFS